MEHEEDRDALLVKTFNELVTAIVGHNDNSEAELRRIMSDNITGFGTGKHEIFNSYEEFINKIFRVFGKQLPADATLHFLEIHHALLGTTGIVHGTYEISYTIDGVKNNYYGRRSTVFQWVNNCWRAIHLHVSEPSAHLVEGESFPVKALKAQNEELKKQVQLKTEALHNSLKNLQDTQQQLIQSAKMASLGEVTSGIAHEIQNPLNFVNNFSEVSNELIDEMKTEIANNNGSLAIELADSIKQNLGKILHHGKRADAIVKAMLQHSRISTGQLEPTEINSLLDEYLRLGYHGFKVKDKSFDVTTQTNFDKSIIKINIIPQDIGRVILSLVNNAFYAVNEKRKQNLSGYKPFVSVGTQKINNTIEIRVADNGNGIPGKVLDKIFQPFFTTKPTGEGTGLGLSLSYDIVKSHGGELTVDTKEGEGATFIIKLPLASTG